MYNIHLAIHFGMETALGVQYVIAHNPSMFKFHAFGKLQYL